MRTLRATPSAFAALPLLFAALRVSSAAEGEDKRFEPARAFPLECLAWLQVPSGSGLARAVSETLPGRLALDSEVRRALGSLPQFVHEQLRAEAEQFIEATGLDPLEVLGLLEGEFALSVAGLDAAAGVRAVAAIELGSRRGQILAVLEKASAYLRGAGWIVSTLEIGKRNANVWRKAGSPPLHHLVLGTHLVFSTSPDALRGAVEAYDGAPGSADFTLGANQRFAEATAGLKLEQPRLVFFLNLEAIRGLIMTFAGRMPEAQEVVKSVQATGLTSLTSLGCALGSRGPDLEWKVHLGTGGGARGLLKELLASVGRPGDLSGALALAPAGASTLGAVAIDGGRIFRALDRFLREGLPPEPASTVKDLLRKIEEKCGLSFEKDLFTLGKLEALLVSFDPPAGGLIPDSLALVRTEAFAPYRAILLKAVRALGKEERTLEGPAAPGTGARAQMRYFRAGSVFSRLAEMGDLPPPLGIALAVVQPPISLADCDLEGGWTVAAAAPQAVWRYLSQPRGAPSGLAGRWAEFAEAEGFVVLNARPVLLALYNTAAALAGSAGPFLDSHLAAFGIDFSLLPPGEKFLTGPREGFLRLDTGPEGLTLHGHRFFPAGGLLPILLIGVALGGVGWAG